MASRSDVLPAGYRLRRAEPRDRGPILAFTGTTFDWGDYIEEVWSEWLTDPAGALWVVADAERDAAVAVAHVQALSATEAWLEGVRVHPDHRRQGLADSLNLACCGWASDQGLATARLGIERDNLAPRRQVERLGWTRVAAFHEMRSEEHGRHQPSTQREHGIRAPHDGPGREELARGPGTGPGPARWAGIRDTEAVARLWQSRNDGSDRASGGLFAEGWAFRRLTWSDLADALSESRVVLADRPSSNAPAGLAIVDRYGDSEVRVAWLEGPDDVLLDLARAVASHLAGGLGGDKTALSAMVPDHGPNVNAWTECGFSPRISMVIYARSLAGLVVG